MPIPTPRSLRLSVAALLLLLLWPVPGSRAGESTPVSRPGVLHVTLPSAVRMALGKNYVIQVAELNPKIAQEELTRQWGIFDPVLGLGASRAFTNTRSAFDPTGLRLRTDLETTRDVLLDTGVNGLTPLGTQYRFGFSAIGTADSRNGFDSYSAGPTFGLSQPLLRGLGPNATMAGIRIARTNVEISEWGLRQQIIDTITQLVYTYNELHFSQENLKVAIRTRELARQLLQDNTRRAAIGVMSPLDITTARAEVASREEGVILADRAVKDNAITLKRLITNELEPMLDISVEIEPPGFYPTRLEVRKGIHDALELRPDYRSTLLDLKNRHVTVAFAKNQVLPQLDLVASLGLLGFDDAFIGSVGRINRGDNFNWSAGANFSIPLGNHAAKGALNAARLQAAQTILELKRIEQQIVVDVEIAAGQVTTGRARIESTSEASRLAQESLDAGEQRLKAGTGTTFEVLELQKKLAEAESAELRARSDYNKAVAEFYRKTGRTLQAHRVDLQ